MGKFSVRTVFAHDWPLTLAGLEYVAGSACAIELVGAYRNTGDLIAALDDIECDIVLVDHSMRHSGQMDWLKLFERLRLGHPNVGVVALVTYENPVIIRSMLSSGVSSVVSKHDDVGHIVTAIHTSYGGGRYLSPAVRQTLDSTDEDAPAVVKLSPREIEVISLYLAGISINRIAERLNKGKQTVSAQKISAMKKLGVKNDIELVQRAASLDLAGGPLRPAAQTA
ncbi:DNA-binding response regulator [Burkholderia sp. Bp8963]|uniref:response regulator transcription factor n=1 Tax=Burkholderia sp. Bp8963 TaxID=2184547 RepID=UPI000F5A08AC|nr:response regulator transcription factor [Burkholderia sp. Bp8963]RQS72654.1 DNA-binding response regulator [Burkholderia sp. Bp8963]